MQGEPTIQGLIFGIAIAAAISYAGAIFGSKRY